MDCTTCRRTFSGSEAVLARTASATCRNPSSFGPAIWLKRSSAPNLISWPGLGSGVLGTSSAERSAGGGDVVTGGFGVGTTGSGAEAILGGSGSGAETGLLGVSVGRTRVALAGLISSVSHDDDTGGVSIGVRGLARGARGADFSGL